jgi:hypothetical protein
MSEEGGFPRAHLGATLRVYDALSATAGGHPEAARVREIFADTGALPEAGAPSMKYDVYLATDGAHLRWGATLNDRWEGAALLERVEPRARAWGYDLSPFRALRARLGPGPALTVAFGFDRPDQPPRLKLYLQEDRWRDGVCTGAELRALLGDFGLADALPEWVDGDRSVGVVTLDNDARGHAFKIYLGGASALDACRGAPDEILALARTLAESCPLAPAYHYLTLRLDPCTPPRYAVNKIYDVARLAGAAPDGRLDAWRDVKALFALAGRRAELRRVLDALAPLADLTILPTATALEMGGKAADVYVTGYPAR